MENSPAAAIKVRTHIITWDEIDTEIDNNNIDDQTYRCP